MNNPAWQNQRSLKLVHLLLTSYKSTYGEDLLDFSSDSYSNIEQAIRVFNMQNPLLSHDLAKDPCLNYVNAAALLLWKKSWDEMIGMPSRLTTPRKEQQLRQKALNHLSQKDAIENYQGIRINSEGELFMIENARIWTILDETSCIVGQAATFSSWRKI